MKNKFKVGDKVKVMVRGGISGNKFDIGEIVTIITYINGMLQARSERNGIWWIYPEEIEKVKVANSIPLKPKKKHIADASKMVSGLDYDSYLKRLIELGNKFKEEPENKDSWLMFLLGYIEACKELIK